MHFLRMKELYRIRALTTVGRCCTLCCPYSVTHNLSMRALARGKLTRRLVRALIERMLFLMSISVKYSDGIAYLIYTFQPATTSRTASQLDHNPKPKTF